MKNKPATSRCRDLYEYHGNTEVKRIRKKGDAVISRDWLVFDSVDEAMEFYNAQGENFFQPSVPAWMIHEMTAL